MGGTMRFSIFLCSVIVLAGCAGMKVVKPEDENKDAGALALDLSTGEPKLVSTYSCKLDSGNNRLSAIGKTEEEARKEVIARCRDRTVVSSCDASKVKCVKN